MTETTTQDSFVENAAIGDLAGVESSLSNGADPEGVDSYGRIALVAAAGAGHADVVRRLLKASSKDAFTALLTASSCCGPQVLSVALRRQCGHREVVQALLESGVDVDQAHETGRTALWNAVVGGQVAIVESLIRAGADVNKRVDIQFVAPPKVERQRTALMYAAAMGHSAVVQCLIEHGADVEARDAEGLSAADIASARRNAGIAALLREKSAKA